MILLCIADIHGKKEKLVQLLRREKQVDSIIVAGDITHLGGRKEAEDMIEPLLETGFPLLAVPGNMDRPEILGLLESHHISLHGRGTIINGGLGLMGLGAGIPSPFSCPFTLTDERMAKLLEAGYASIREAACRITVSHVPPLDTELDLSFLGKHAGSKVLRKFLESEQPELCICGHIHESAGLDRIGNTICVNVGDLRSGNYCLITIDQDAVKRSTSPEEMIDIDRRKV